VRIGYIVPEFPGQTHIFFWRELQSLADMGVDCDLVSTQLPSQKIISHSWSREAMNRTTYLSPPTIGGAILGITTVIRAGPVRWWRMFQAVLNADVANVGTRLRLIALGIAGAQIAAIARRRNWCHIHVHSCADSAHVALFAHLIGGVSYSLTLHGPLEDYGSNQAMKWRHAAFGIVITHKLLKELRAALDAASPREIDVAPMGVDTQVFHRSVPYRAWDGSEPFKIFSCGRLNPCKGHDDLIRAVALMRAAGIDARLRIAGADDAQGLYARALEDLVEELHLGYAVTLLGAVSEENVREGLEESHVFALASLHEPLGVAIMEAMAMELPVVVTTGGGVQELVDHNIDGIFVEPRSPEGLARGLERIANDPLFAARLAGLARKKVETSFQFDQSARTLVRLLKSNCNGR
jgi:glycosyltransferase involved in cell wall biosynthesis